MQSVSKKWSAGFTIFTKRCVNRQRYQKHTKQFSNFLELLISVTWFNKCLMDHSHQIQCFVFPPIFSICLKKHHLSFLVEHQSEEAWNSPFAPETWWMHAAPDPMNWKAITSTNHLGGWGKQTTSNIPPNSAHVLVLLLTHASIRKGLFVSGVNKNSTVLIGIISILLSVRGPFVYPPDT